MGLVGGSVPFLLFFEGLSRATSTQAAFIHKSLLVWVVILAIILLKERLGIAHVAALGLLVWGQISLAGGITDLGMGSGELMVLAATLMWSVEVIVATANSGYRQTALLRISSGMRVSRRGPRPIRRIRYGAVDLGELPGVLRAKSD